MRAAKRTQAGYPLGAGRTLGGRRPDALWVSERIAFRRRLAVGHEGGRNGMQSVEKIRVSRGKSGCIGSIQTVGNCADNHPWSCSSAPEANGTTEPCYYEIIAL
jgi:hypothetical protein